MKRFFSILTCMATVGFATPSQAAPSPVLAFISSSTDADHYQSFVIRVLYSDGSVGDPVNPPQTHVIDPAWSPDGSRIAFSGLTTACVPTAGCAGGSFGIWVVNADGTGGIQIQTPPTGGYGRGPKWSPDGTRIVYTRKPADEAGDGKHPHPDLWVLTDMGGGVWTDEPLIARPGFEYLTDFSPDGRRIAYGYAPDDDGFRERGDPRLDFDLFVSSSDGAGAPRRLTRLEGTRGGIDPTWSPDGKKIAFEVGKDLWLIRADGSRARLIFKSRVQSGQPDFSPDGTSIAFAQCGERQNCRILSVAATWPYAVEGLVDLPEVLDMMPDYFPVS